MTTRSAFHRFTKEIEYIFPTSETKDSSQELMFVVGRYPHHKERATLTEKEERSKEEQGWDWPIINPGFLLRARSIQAEVFFRKFCTDLQGFQAFNLHIVLGELLSIHKLWINIVTKTNGRNPAFVVDGDQGGRSNGGKLSESEVGVDGAMEARSLSSIRYALEVLEDQLDCL